MKILYLITSTLLLLPVTGCQSHHDRLFFAEKTHFGLRAELEPESQTPGNVHFGYKRSIATLIPCKNVKKIIVEDKEKTICGSKDGSIDTDNNILSVISSFNTRVTWSEGTRVQTFFATGKAASETTKDVDTIKALVTFPKKIN